MKFSELVEITGGVQLQCPRDYAVLDLATDSRKAICQPTTLFFAIAGDHHDGHRYINDLYKFGVRQFVVEADVDLNSIPEACVVRVPSSVWALQAIATKHRSSFDIPVIGITGSNGKTIIKEWLFQLLSRDYIICKNPGSYNSQIGVPLSVWNLQPYHQLGIFEAGISKPGEMEKLVNVINPTIGLFANVGSAHDEGFESTEEKVVEKMKLFAQCKTLIYCRDHQDIHPIAKRHAQTLTWGSEDADVLIKHDGESYQIKTGNTQFEVSIPYKDKASIENILHCIVVMIALGVDQEIITQRVQGLQHVPMRLELKEGINNTQLVDDTYNNDLGGLRISVDFLLEQRQRTKKRLILSDIMQSGLDEETLVTKIAAIVDQAHLDGFIGVGPALTKYGAKFNVPATFFASTEDLLEHLDRSSVEDEIILIKGARAFAFERVVSLLQQKQHGTALEIDLGAVSHNLNLIRAHLPEATGLMVMVKAFAYGSGSTEIANLLRYHKVNYLGVAYADEGADLRRNNIVTPIMVMNPAPESFDQLMWFNLEPEMYSFHILDSFIAFLCGRQASIHIKLDTGMHRLGFNHDDLHLLIEKLSQNRNLTVASIFSHLAGADEQGHDEFSRQQAKKFQSWADTITAGLGYKPLYHLLNSSGIIRLREYAFDMVRLGIGLYGVDPTGTFDGLQPVATLKTTISQIMTLPKGDTIGYSRKGVLTRESKIATIAIGYADGYSRAFGNGAGKVLVNGQIVPVVGNVCMDMTMIDVTDITAAEGDSVEIYGKSLSIDDVAKWSNTIPYEILTNTSSRVKRVFVADSI